MRVWLADIRMNGRTGDTLLDTEATDLPDAMRQVEQAIDGYLEAEADKVSPRDPAFDLTVQVLK